MRTHAREPVACHLLASVVATGALEAGGEGVRVGSGLGFTAHKLFGGFGGSAVSLDTFTKDGEEGERSRARHPLILQGRQDVLVGDGHEQIGGN